MTHDIRAQTITITGHGGDKVEAYLAEPVAPGSYGGVVVIHHLPGYDRSTKEVVRRFAADLGYIAVMPNLYTREAPGASPDDAAAAARARGGVPDEQVIGDVKGAADHIRAMPSSNGKVGCLGHCSGGRQTFLVATTPSVGLDAAVDCYGGAVVYGAPAGAPLNMPALLDRTRDLSCPLLGLFGEDDKFPGPDEVAVLAKELDAHGKTYEFHSYPGASHAFFDVDRPSYRVEAALDGWKRIKEHFATYLQSH
jgi:carboxymethylenebutenolidase